MKPFDDSHTFTHRHGPNAKSQVATEDKMVDVNVSESILPVKLSQLSTAHPHPHYNYISSAENRGVGRFPHLEFILLESLRPASACNNPFLKDGIGLGLSNNCCTMYQLGW